MKYFTQQWYDDMQVESAFLSLRANSQADSYSEEFFQELYQKRLQERLDSAKEQSAITFEDLPYPEFAVYLDTSADIAERIQLVKLHAHNNEVVMFVDGTVSAEERCRLADEHHRCWLESKATFEAPYDEEKNITLMALSHQNGIANMKNILPADILANIADIRVLALDIATADNIERIKDYCLTIEARQTQIAADYTAHYRSIVDQLPEVLRKDFAMHDSVIRGFSIDERHNLVLDISGFIQLSIK